MSKKPKKSGIEEYEMLEHFLSKISKLEDLRFFTILAHICAEYYIDKFIKLEFKNTEELEEVFENSFKKKLIVLKSKGFEYNPDILSILKNLEILNTIRNKFAHNIFLSEIKETDTDPEQQSIASLIKNMFLYEDKSETYKRAKEKADNDIIYKFKIVVKCSIFRLFQLSTERLKEKDKVKRINKLFKESIGFS